MLAGMQLCAFECGAYIFTGNGVDDIIGRCSEKLRDDGKLINVVLAGEQRLAVEHLGKDAACAPNVDLDVIFLPCEHNLGSAVVSGGNVARHLGVLNSGETKVANLQIAVFVDEDVARFQVTMNDAGRVDVLETALERGRVSRREYTLR